MASCARLTLRWKEELWRFAFLPIGRAFLGGSRCGAVPLVESVTPCVGSHYRPIINCQLDPKGQEAIILYTHMHFITNKFHLYHSVYILQEL